MAEPDAPAIRRLLSPVFLPPLLLWALFCATLGSGIALYLHRASVAATEGIYERAEAAAAVAEHTLLRAFEAVQSVHDLLQLRQGLLEADEAPGAHAIQAHIADLVRGGRFGIIQAGVVDRGGIGVWGTGPGIAGLWLADREHVRVHLDGTADGLFVSRPVLGRTTNRWGIQATRPVRDLWGRVVGVGVVSLDPLALSRGLGQGANGTAQATIVRRLADGAIIARSRDIEARLGEPGVPDHPAVAASALMALALQVALSWARGRRLRQRLQIEAERDPLTGLLNRRALQAQAARLLAQAAASNRPAAVLLLDLDRFKSINDAHGHAAGDAVLRDVAAVLAREIRRDDLACRWGGEEMLAVLPDCDLRRAEALAAALRVAIKAARPGSVPGVLVTASIGVAAFPEHGAGLEELTGRADTALYAAKRSGRDRVVCALAA